MKKVILFTTILILSIPSFASWKNAMLRLKHEMGRSISITIDDRKYNKIGRSITVKDLSPGMHRIKIYKYNTNGYGYSNGILIYQGTLKVRPSRIYYVTVSNDGIDVEENCCIDDYGQWNNNEDWNNDDDLLNPANDHEDHWNNNHEWNHHQQGHENQPDQDWGSYKGQMSEGRFAQLIEQVRKASFETSKESVAKQALKTNKISCNQLSKLLNEFSFESTKLQLAKDAYRNVTDKNNYFLINDVFTFQSSKDELLEFLEKMGK